MAFLRSGPRMLLKAELMVNPVTRGHLKIQVASVSLWSCKPSKQNLLRRYIERYFFGSGTCSVRDTKLKGLASTPRVMLLFRGTLTYWSSGISGTTKHSIKGSVKSTLGME